MQSTSLMFPRRFGLIALLFIYCLCAYGQNSSVSRKNHDIRVLSTVTDDTQSAFRATVLDGSETYRKAMKKIREHRNSKQDDIDVLYKSNIDKYDKLSTAIHIKDSMENAANLLASNLASKTQAKFFTEGFYLFPATNTFSTNAYYSRTGDNNNWQTLSNTYLTSNYSDRASAFSEILSVNFLIFRLGLHTMIAGTRENKITQDDINSILDFGADSTMTTLAEVEKREAQLDSLRKTKETQNKIDLAAQNMITGGSNLALNLSSPLFWYNNSERTIIAHSEAFFRAGAVAPEIGTLSSEGSFTYAFGLTGNFWLDFNPLGQKDKTSMALSVAPSIMWIKNSFYEEQFGTDGTVFYGEVLFNFEVSQTWRFTFKLPFVDKDMSDEAKDAFKFQFGVNVIL